MVQDVPAMWQYPVVVQGDSKLTFMQSIVGAPVSTANGSLQPTEVVKLVFSAQDSLKTILDKQGAQSVDLKQAISVMEAAGELFAVKSMST
jgi:hypothetical protein